MLETFCAMGSSGPFKGTGGCSRDKTLRFRLLRDLEVCSIFLTALRKSMSLITFDC